MPGLQKGTQVTGYNHTQFKRPHLPFVGYLHLEPKRVPRIQKGTQVTDSNQGFPRLHSLFAGQVSLPPNTTFTPQLKSCCNRFHLQRSSGQAVVTGVFPSPPQYLPSFLSRIWFSILTFQLFVLVKYYPILLTHALALSATAGNFLPKKN